MKIEVRCGQCGRGYLVDETRIPASGALIPCPSCGASVALKASPSVASGPALRPAAAAESGRTNEVCCPRCNLHFVPESRPGEKAASRRTLLIVEDMEYFIELARDSLSSRYELRVAKTVDEARALILRGGIDLMLLDLTLERGEDGLRLLKEPPGKTCPVLLFTAQDESEMYGESWSNLRALGVDDVVIKGMNMGETLMRKVAEMLGESIPQDTHHR